MQRPFSSGSRQTPDPCDMFLEDHNLYRKHTARDSSCLFRVISEQMYDTQMHHYEIRKKCVRYMRRHQKYFSLHVDRNLDEYLDDMAKTKTYGGLLELKALGYMFERNVVLYEPFTLGKFHTNRAYESVVFRVFYSANRHFDSVFTTDFIEKAAMCQTICYELIYKDLFKLPDVSFAVEQMLHPLANEYYFEKNEAGYCIAIHFSDGRSFALDLPDDSACILENFKLCHFHYNNFPSFSDDLQREIRLVRSDYERCELNKVAEPFLPDKFTSCVRQLLQEGITPFPYKVAKALDPNMYRNIEFDSWNEKRRYNKLQNWYNGGFNFKIGAKCYVKLHKSEGEIYTCHIQDITADRRFCVVFIEQLGEKRTVPFDSLLPLSSDEFKPWALPYRLQRHMQKCSTVRFTRHLNCRFKFNERFSTSAHEYPFTTQLREKFSEYSDKQFAEKSCNFKQNNSYYKLKQYTHLENFCTDTIEYCTMPLTVEHDEKPKVNDSGFIPVENASSLETSTLNDSAVTTVSVDGNLTAAVPLHSPTIVEPIIEQQQQVITFGQNIGDGLYMPEQQTYYTLNPYAMPDAYADYNATGNLQQPGTAYIPTAYAGACLVPNPYYYYGSTSTPTECYVSPTSNLFVQTTTALTPTAESDSGCFTSSTYYSNDVSFNNNVDITNPEHTPGQLELVNMAEAASAPNIWNAKKSIKPNASDMPTDMATVRYFYNLGLECHRTHLKRIAERDAQNSDQLANLTVEMPKLNINENNPQDQHDANNKNAGNLTQSSAQHQSRTNNANIFARRYPTRYYNSKERPLKKNPFTNSTANDMHASSSSAVSLAAQQKTQRIQNEYHLKQASLNKKYPRRPTQHGHDKNSNSQTVDSKAPLNEQQARNQAKTSNNEGQSNIVQNSGSSTPLTKQQKQSHPPPPPKPNNFGPNSYRVDDLNEIQYGTYATVAPDMRQRPPMNGGGVVYALPPTTAMPYNMPQHVGGGGFYPITNGAEMAITYPPPMPYYYAGGIVDGANAYVGSPIRLKGTPQNHNQSAQTEFLPTNAGRQGFWYAPSNTIQAPMIYTEAGAVGGSVTNATASGEPILMIAAGNQNMHLNNRHENQQHVAAMHQQQAYVHQVQPQEMILLQQNEQIQGVPPQFQNHYNNRSDNNN